MPPRKRTVVYKTQNGLCHSCSKSFKPDKLVMSRKDRSVDDYSLNNLRLICHKCFSSEGVIPITIGDVNG